MNKNSTKHEMPHDLLAERSLVGCLMIDQMAFDHVIEVQLAADDFYDPKLAVVFTAIRDLRFQSVVIDFISVCSRLNDMGKLEWLGGQSFVLDLIEEQASAANVVFYAKTVKDKSLLRQIIRSAVQVIENSSSFSGSVQDYVSDVEANFFKLTSQFRLGGLRDIKTFLKLNLKDLEDSQRKKGEIAGLPTGFIDLDRMLLGLQPGQLVVLAARPGVGKTSFAMTLAVNASKASGLPVAIFSLEMLAPELSMRILSSEASVDSMRLKTKNLLDTDLRNISKALKDLSQLPIYINDSADITLIDIKSQCRKIKAEQGLGMIMIDYLQLMNSHSKVLSREQQISEISRGLKNLAKELECPIIALSQLNRAVESRQDRRPLISDLRESGSIEQDADIVCLIYRDEMYNPDSKDKGIAEIIIAKNRSGERGTVKLAWIGAQTKFASLHHEANQQTSQHRNLAPPPNLPQNHP
jgi:replicative DNA helicase